MPQRRKRIALLKYLLVGIGGFFGSVARYGVGLYVSERIGTRFPLGTFVINISGSFAGGFILSLFAARAFLNPNLKVLLVIGFIGAYTTFSAFELETLHSVQDGDWQIALLNILLSVVVCFAAAWAGEMLWKAVS